MLFQASIIAAAEESFAFLLEEVLSCSYDIAPKVVNKTLF